MTFVQYDDFLDPAMVDEFERMMKSDQFPWQYYANVNYSVPPPEGHRSKTLMYDEKRFQDSFGFSSVIYPEGADTNSPWFAIPRQILEAVLDKQGVRAQELLRIKANLLVRSPVADPRPFTPHVDMPKPHWAMIYYVNDSDGDNVIFDKMYPDSENAVVLHTASPKKGRAIMFDGRHYHSGTVPSRHDTRIVINYDFL